MIRSAAATILLTSRRASPAALNLSTGSVITPYLNSAYDAVAQYAVVPMSSTTVPYGLLSRKRKGVENQNLCEL